MPTPTGLPKVGDILVHSETGDRYQVVKRDGNDRSCSVILKPVEVKVPHNTGYHHAYGYPRDHFRLLEAMYWIGRTYRFEER